MTGGSSFFLPPLGAPFFNFSGKVRLKGAANCLRCQGPNRMSESITQNMRVIERRVLGLRS